MRAAVHDALRRFWRRSVRRIGVAGWLGVALLALAGAGFALAAGLQHSAQSTAQELALRRARLARLPLPASAPMGEQERSARFVEAFPPFDQNVTDLRQIFELAELHHVSLAKGDYTVQADPSSPFVSYVVNLPIHEPYPAVKRFAAAVLQALPHAALDELRVSRADAGNTVPDTTLRFSLVYRPAVPRPAP